MAKCKALTESVVKGLTMQRPLISTGTSHVAHLVLAVWRSGNRMVSINEVTLRRARFVLG